MPQDIEKSRARSRRYYYTHREVFREKSRRFRKRHPNRSTKYYHINKIKALTKIAGGKIQCIACGCDDLNILEINHKNGGGTKEHWGQYLGDPGKFYRDIIKGVRTVEDLNIKCRVCNTLDYLERKYGKLPYKKIVWGVNQ